jgi:hypothetical protein
MTWLAIAVLLAAGGCSRTPKPPGATPPPPTTAPAGLFPGDSLDGWRVSDWSDLRRPQQVPGEAWKMDGGVLSGLGRRTWLFSEGEYADFVLSFDVRISRGANGGVGLRFPPEGDPAYTGLELQVVDHEVYYRGRSRPEQRTGSIYDEIAAKDAPAPVERWTAWQITCKGSRVAVVIDGQTVLDADLSRETKARQQKGPPLSQRPRKGRIGFQNLSQRITFRNLRLREL